MIENTKITLSAKELELVCNTGWILTKHRIIQKVYMLFGNASEAMQQQLSNIVLPHEIKEIAPKISKGENYLLLPYVMLDYPRFFNKENTMAIRSFFWWGNSVSMHLLLTGIYKTAAINKLIANFKFLQDENYSVCIGETPWKHHFEADNYLFCKDCTENFFSDTLHRKPFIKIGRKIELDKWNEIPEFLQSSFIEMIGLIKEN